MASDPKDSTGFSLRRWSQRKREAARDAGETLNADAAREANVHRDADAVQPPDDGTANRTQALTATSAQDATLPQLPSLESLTIDSDYAAFMRPGVDDSLKCGALKKLFSDPRFNVMDGLDVYVGDYSIPDPIDPAIVRTLMQARYIFNPPATRVNAQGHVEDVPEPPEAVNAEENAPPPTQCVEHVAAVTPTGATAVEGAEKVQPDLP